MPLVCNRCRTVADLVLVNGILSEPPGWEGLALTGKPMLHMRLCPDCVRDVRELLATTPEQAAEREEAARRASFGAGFDAGLAEPRDTDDAIIRSAGYCVRTCRACGCTDDDCAKCIERTGQPCSWVEADLCSAHASTNLENAHVRSAS